MRFVTFSFSALLLFVPSISNAQCFNRLACGDPSTVLIRSQVSLNVPLSAQASSTDAMKTMEDARRDLYTMSVRECDTLKSIYGGECTLTEVSINSSIQERGTNNRVAFVSISNAFALKKASK